MRMRAALPGMAQATWEAAAKPGDRWPRAWGRAWQVPGRKKVPLTQSSLCQP